MTKRRKIDPHVEEVYKEIATELNVSESKVRSMVLNFINWTRYSMANAEYACYYWPKFGTFTYHNRARGPYYKEADDYLLKTSPNKTAKMWKNSFERKQIELQKQKLNGLHESTVKLQDKE